MGLYNI